MSTSSAIGPILFAGGGDDHTHRLHAIVAVRAEHDAPACYTFDGRTVDATSIDTLFGYRVWRYAFELPVTDTTGYVLADRRYRVRTDWRGAERIAYMSCNGMEDPEPGWNEGSRFAMWRRLADEHARSPLSLMLHGGDQLYADSVLEAHPALERWAAASVDERDAFAFTDAMREAAECAVFELYREYLTAPPYATLASEVPSMMMWDDHDIMDGWGSHPTPLLDSAVGQGLYEIGRRFFMVLQQGRPYDGGGTTSLTTSIAYGDLAVIAPDLRSARRPNRVMDAVGWARFESALEALDDGTQLFLMSSVPLLGPRLSWVERLVPFVPKATRYADDLRDQWQSRAHRAEWIRCLRTLERFAAERQGEVTVLSGEIHLATRGDMPMKHGHTLHQLVASGVAHPAPPTGFARALGWLAVFGEGPLSGQPVRLHALPGQRRIYTAERNYLLVSREAGRWSASWELEESGRTEPFRLSAA